jgi:hypothetical protein
VSRKKLANQPDPKPRRVRFELRLPDDLVKRLDEEADRGFRTRNSEIELRLSQTFGLCVQ